MSATPVIPESLRVSCGASDTTSEWLRQLPETILELAELWELALGAPFDGPEVSAAWVAPVLHRGIPAVLKLGMPHFEGEHELEGLQFWNGDPTVRLLRSDAGRNAMLLERCEPGRNLRSEPDLVQDEVIAGLLRRLWRVPTSAYSFRSLSEMLSHWSDEARRRSHLWPDAGLVEEGLSLFGALPQTSGQAVLLATDLHAGNVLRAEREPWLVIDPKPFVGDPAYDATQHLFNCATRIRRDPLGTIARFADVLELEAERIRLWTFARAAAAPGDEWRGDGWSELAWKLRS